MRRVTLSIAAGAMLLAGTAQAAPPIAADPYLDLEQVDGAKALATVKGWNGWTTDKLEALPGFAAYRSRAETLLSDDRKIAEPERIFGNRVLNFWQDAAHPRGLWRISPLAAFAAGKPEWRTLIDVGALGKAEGKRWVFKGATCLSPAYVRCIVSLSDGGGDAAVEREYDLDTGAFVDGGFALPAAKSEISWAGPDALYVGTDFGRGQHDRLGLCAHRQTVEARHAAEPARPTVSEGQAERRRGQCHADYWSTATGPGRSCCAAIDFYHHKLSHIAPDGRLVASPLPDDADLLGRDRRPADCDAQERVERPSRGCAGCLFDPRSARRQGRPRSRRFSCRPRTRRSRRCRRANRCCGLSCSTTSRGKPADAQARWRWWPVERGRDRAARQRRPSICPPPHPTAISPSRPSRAC